MANPSIGKGTTLTFTGISGAKVLSIRGPQVTAEAIDTSHQGSTDGWRTCVAGLIDGGQIVVEVVLDTGIGFGCVGGDAATLTITFSNGGSVSGSAVCVGYSPSVPFNGLATAELTFKAAGKLTITGGS